MILITIGTYPLQFDRLIKAVDLAVKHGRITEEIFAQIGYCRYEPTNMPFKRMMNKDEFDSYFADASAIISHAGMGTITMALDNYKPLLVVPRMKEYGEHVNDHQLGTAKRFEELGHVMAVYDADHIPEKIKQLKDFVPAQRLPHPEKVAARIGQFLREIHV